MTIRGPIRIEPDGTRVYSNYQRYKPMADEDRVNKRRKPDHPDAVRHGARWFLPLPLLADEDREPMPLTRPDTDAYDHMSTNLWCRCDVCKRPEAERWRRKWRRDRGLRP